MRASTRKLKVGDSMPVLFAFNALAAVFMGVETLRVAGDVDAAYRFGIDALVEALRGAGRAADDRPSG